MSLCQSKLTKEAVISPGLGLSEAELTKVKGAYAQRSIRLELGSTGYPDIKFRTSLPGMYAVFSELRSSFE